MGLDLALGLIVLVGALRGWFRGFSSQASRLIGLVSCVYLAQPVRDQVRPWIVSRMPAIDSALLDRMLWWVCAVVSYLVVAGMLMLAFQLLKTPSEQGTLNPRRGDRLGGLFLGAAKAALFAAVLAAGVHRYSAELSHNFSWVERQTNGSYALEWTEAYRPIPRLWATAPVKSFVEQIQRNGPKRWNPDTTEKQLAERPLNESSSLGRAPRLDLPSIDWSTAPVPEDLDAANRAIEELKKKVELELAPQTSSP